MQAGVQHLLYQFVHNYVCAFTTNKPDPTPCTVIYSLGARCGCSFPSCPGNCMTVHSFARSKLPQNMMNDVRLFPVYWFWATVCASTRDNWYWRINRSKYSLWIFTSKSMNKVALTWYCYCDYNMMNYRTQYIVEQFVQTIACNC